MPLQHDVPRPILPGRPDLIELYEFSWTLAFEKARTSYDIHHMDTAFEPPKNWQWVWDLSFVSLYARYSNGLLPVLGAYDVFYKLQAPDGYISMAYDFDTGKELYGTRINPPLFAWGEWEYYRATGDGSRFARVVGHIEKLMEWIDANRRTEPMRCRKLNENDIDVHGTDRDHLLMTFRPYYFLDGGSSGMDDSPRTARKPDAGQFFGWIDLTSQMALSFKCLARMYGVLGNDEKVAYWEKRFSEISDMLNEEFWCERIRFYLDRGQLRNFVNCKTAASFWPLLAGVCDTDRRDALVAHLLDVREFNRPFPVPTLSADDPNYTEEGRYWLGGVWAPTNYMITRGLMESGRGDVAHGIAKKYLDGLSRTFAEFSPATLWESYSPEWFTPGRRPYATGFVRPNFVGWTAIGPIAMLLENIIGINLDAPAASATWDIRLVEEHGVERLRVAEGAYLSIRCATRESEDAPAEISIACDVPFTVTVRCAGREQCVVVKPGTASNLTV